MTNGANPLESLNLRRLRQLFRLKAYACAHTHTGRLYGSADATDATSCPWLSRVLPRAGPPGVALSRVA